MLTPILIAFAGFAFASSITPGPNNLMLMASGANFGFRRTGPHIAGVALGFAFMVFLVGLGIIAIFNAFPPLYTILKVLSALYLLWLAWKIATAAPPDAKTPTGRPFSFWQAVAFQWVNPKGWMMAISATSIYAPDQTLPAITAIAALFGLIGAPCMAAWALLGQEMRRILNTPARLRGFNISMGVILVLSMIPVLFSDPASTPHMQ